MELAAGVVHSNSTSNDGNTVGVPFNISAPGNCPGPWMHPDQTLIGGLSSVVGCANVTASSDIIASSSPYGPATWEDLQVNNPGYPFTMPQNYQDYPYETQPGSMGLIKPDVAAPGNGTTSTSAGGGYSSFSGTSGATPHVGGTAALILSANPDLEPADVSRILQTTAVEKGDPGKDNRYGAGRIDAYQAYLQAFAEAGTPLSPASLLAYSNYLTPDEIRLTWEDPTHLLNGDTLTAGAFHIFIERDGAFIDSVEGGLEYYFDSGLNDGQYYDYSIYAVVDSSQRESDRIQSGWIAGGSPIPTPPLQVEIANEDQQVRFFWENPSINIDGTPMDDLAGINLYRDSIMVASFARTSADSGSLDSAVFVNTAAGFHSWYLTAVDNESPQNESTHSVLLITPLNAPVGDIFNMPGAPSALIWRNRFADINDRAFEPPSGPMALNFNGMPSGGDTLDLYPLDLRGSDGQGVVFSYYYQPQGDGNAPEPGDSLKVYFMNDTGIWVKVRAYPGTNLQPFQHEMIDLDTAPNGGGTYFHSQFQVRITNIGSPSISSPNDDWFVDNIYLGVPAPLFTASYDTMAFDTTVVDSTRQMVLEVQNAGLDSLHVNGWLSTNPLFTIDSVSAFGLGAGSAQMVYISFMPDQAGMHSGMLHFYSDYPSADTLSVAVNGYAKLATGIAGVDNLPLKYELGRNYPNPFNPSTSIHFALPETQEVYLEIYNMLGQKIRTLLSERYAAGYHQAVWDGRNDLGQAVS
ncbi:MAG: S8 family serine peptidase, partial [Calditrichia bacterium]